MERGGAAADSVGGWWQGEAEPALSETARQAYTPRYPSISGTHEMGIDLNTDQANRQLEEGGARAGDELGRRANDAMSRDVESLGAALGRAAAQEISRAQVNVRAPQGGSDGLGAAISNARTGALHGGTE